MRDYFLFARSLPSKWIIQKGIRRIRRWVKRYFRKWRDFNGPTYLLAIPYKIDKLCKYFSPPLLRCLQTKAEEIASVTQNYLEHRFDLLGSGWIQVKHGIICSGIEGHRYQMGMGILADQKGHWLKECINPSNLKMSQQIWELIDPDYVPIDWHLDFKSGYRWSGDTWYLRIPYGHKPGVDIKIPWELARMQHLPQLVWAYILAENGQIGFQPSQRYVGEFRNQVLDFIAANPPRFGVNWRSTMDAAIRVSNWLVTYDLFRACGAVFDESFERTFFQSVYQHGVHIVDNLEWDERLRGNHYLSNIVGLLFVASYLPCTPETNVWLAFAVQELVNEVGFQFSNDGTNFEASTNYHRLSAEMVVYATALVLGLSDEKRTALQEYDCLLFQYSPRLRSCPIPLYSLPGGGRFIPFPPPYIEKLEKMAEFTMHLTKPNGHIPQIGDNDSGRFLKLQPLFRLMKVNEAADLAINLNRSAALLDIRNYWDEDHLDHRHLVAAINGLFGREDFTEYIGSGWFETEIVNGLAKGFFLPSHKDRDAPTAAEREYIQDKQDRDNISRMDDSRPIGKVVSKKDEHLNGNKLYAYPEFGMFIFKSKNIYLAIRCGSTGQNGKRGHSHNDILSFELNVKGRDFVVDGGSYLYTPFPDIRNVFRSTKAHNTLILDSLEQNDWADGIVGLFSMRDDAHAKALKFSNEYFRGEHCGFGPKHYREFILRDSSLIIYDMIEITLPNEINFNLSPEAEVIFLREKGPEEFSLEIENGGDHLTMSLEGFNKVQSSSGYYSSGYGRKVKNTLVRCCRSKPRTSVEIAFR
jgi:hypothetical protein